MKPFLIIYIASVAFLALLHALMGASIALVMALFLIGIGGTAAFLGGRLLPSDLTLFALSLYYGTNNLLVKLLYGQDVSSNIVNSEGTAFYLLVGFASIGVGYLLARQVAPARQAPWGLTKLTVDHPKFVPLSRALFVIGFLSQVLHVLLRPHVMNDKEATSGFGGFGTLEFIMIAGFTFIVARWRMRPDDKTAPLEFAVSLTMLVLLAMFGNIKRPIVLAIGAVLLIIMLFRGRKIGWPSALAGLLTILLLTQVVAPLIHVMRPRLRDYSPSEVIQVASDVLQQTHYSVGELQDAEDATMESLTYVYSAQGTYYYPATSGMDRFTLAFPTDQVVRGLGHMSPLGGAAFSDVVNVLPSFIVGDKSPTAGIDLIAWRFGIRAPGSIARPVLGMIAAAAGTYGIVGCLFLPGLTTFIFMAAVNFLSGPLRSVWGVFMWSATTFEILEQDNASVIGYVIRTLLLVALFGYTVSRYMRARGRRTIRKEPAMARANSNRNFTR